MFLLILCPSDKRSRLIHWGLAVPRRKGKSIPPRFGGSARPWQVSLKPDQWNRISPWFQGNLQNITYYLVFKRETCWIWGRTRDSLTGMEMQLSKPPRSKWEAAPSSDGNLGASQHFIFTHFPHRLVSHGRSSLGRWISCLDVYQHKSLIVSEKMDNNECGSDCGIELYSTSWGKTVHLIILKKDLIASDSIPQLQDYLEKKIK